jgi:hypothetical protein
VGAQHTILADLFNVETIGAISGRALGEMGDTTEIKFPWRVPLGEIDNLAAPERCRRRVTLPS